ncbi:leucyl aminopeptidase family protein [Aestuariivirga sp.]|uniref:leucyl aminopeptidase family protein n=1 Tax=Aestuariivirga sp. TaxID=2650926 RepID=UPI0030192C7C
MTDLADILLPSTARGTAVILIAAGDWEKKRRDLAADVRGWADANGFEAQAGRVLAVAGPKGELKEVLVGSDGSDPFAPGRLCRSLPPGAYAVTGSVAQPEMLALGWCLESYSFGRYGKAAQSVAKLVCPQGVDREAVLRAARASWMVRDLVNTPASDMGPDELEQAARAVARAYKAKLTVTSGKALEKGFPMIYAVGKASPRAPRLIDFAWGPARAPKVTLVGKGVCFDTGGLDIKPASGMALMKKDMGGAANVLGLAQMIMAAGLKVRLRVLIPAVENSIAGNAFRPGDVMKSRKGITVEIGNTDAEGRLVLGDALSLADEEQPDLLIDMATLTGAARVALGPDLPPFFTDNEALAEDIARAGREVNDPVWRLPFWQPYMRLFESSVADMNNAGDSGFAGSITAALFLKRFVEKAKAHVHFDIFAWTPTARPGRPKGGEAQAMRALFEVIRRRAT